MQLLVMNSASPRRRELICLLPFTWELAAISVNEVIPPGMAPGDLALSLAGQKARAACRAYPGSLILGADTVVSAGGKVLGKPSDEADAAHMLRLIAGDEHEVFTGLCLLDADSGRQYTAIECTRVSVSPLSEAEITAYLLTGDPLDKAGAYGIQGPFARYITGIKGCYYNVMGLPVSRLYTLVKQALSLNPGID